ncbi:hypothetical protein RB595_010553 [Gaeumannomyces hyphopodioides]
MQPPSTPTKNHSIDVVRATIKDVFQALNAEVGLELVAPDPTASPSRRRQWADENGYHSRCDRIWTEFQYQFHQGDIDAVLRDFHIQAKQTFSGWVRKFRADPKTLPASAKPYRARDDAEVAVLQELLRDVLVERRKSMPRRAPRLFKKAHSDGAVLEKNGGSNPNPTAFTESAAPARPQIERSSYKGITEESCKKPKNTGKAGGAVAKVSLERASSDLNDLMVRSSFVPESTSFAGPSRARASAAQPQYQPPPAAARKPSPPKRETSGFLNYDASANTSSVSLASAYTSVSADDVPVNTQTTVEASSQELKRVLPSSSQRLRAPPPPAIEPPASSFQFSGAEPTSDELEALWAAENEATVKPPTTPSAKIGPQDTSSSSPSPEPSPTYSPWSGSMVDLLAKQSHMVPETAAEPAPGPAPGPAPEPMPEPVQKAPRKRETLQDRLDLVWPKFPDWLREAPLAVAWEVCRVALHCGVDLSQIKGVTYDSSWVEQTKLWSVLHQLHEFKAHHLPKPSPPLVWAAALDSFKSRGQNVVLTASMNFSTVSTGPLFVLKMLPLKFDQPYRLSRRFGSDRFLEILYPSPNPGNAPTALKGEAGEDARETTNRWLVRGQHWLVGRQWVPFYTKDDGYKQPTIDMRLGPEPPKVYKDKTYFFAVDGHNFQTPPPRHSLPPKDQEITRRTKLSVHKMLDWLLQLGENMDKPYLKLFSRIALGLSKTDPTVTFEKHQIRREKDLLSPLPSEDTINDGVGLLSPPSEKPNVMNDGVGRMSRSVARKVQKILGLTSVPCAIQGRLGSAKGMWIIDVKDVSDEDWIETYPSQRKWECDFSDPDHRTLEVLGHASELHSARLNLQFLAVLEDRSRDKVAIRAAVGDLLKVSVKAELEGLRVALNHPIQFRQWVHENSTNRDTRIRYGEVPFLGGMPDKDEEMINLMLDHGFDPKEQKYLQDLAWKLQKQKCETLKKKLNISVGRSAYVYMVVDFWDLLKEDEVHICFSNKFQADDDFADTLLDGIDLLVARSPAHYVSDIQKVKAVFKPALKGLKDVIVFPCKGNVALADKLSGGDYDGDKAWVCWDPAIVTNFANAPVPDRPNLFDMDYLNKITETMGDLVITKGFEDATSAMIERSFLFHMRQNYTGECTNFKERLCYKRRNVNDKVAVLLSTLLSNLVDQSKQGIEFPAPKWRRLKADLCGGKDPGLPLYKGNWAGRGELDHIIDYLKFAVAKPLIDEELVAFDKAINSSKKGRKLKDPVASPTKNASAEMIDEASSAHYFDRHLTAYYDWFDRFESPPVKKLLESLKRDILRIEEQWKRRMVPLRENGGEGVNGSGGDSDFCRKVREVYDLWCEILPDKEAHESLADSGLVGMLEQSSLLHPEDSLWALLRASTAFKLLYWRSHTFVWRMAGRQLMRIKSQKVAAERGGTPATSVVPNMYAALRPDGKIIKQLVAREEGSGSQYTGADEGDGTGGGDRSDYGDDDEWADHGSF